MSTEMQIRRIDPVSKLIYLKVGKQGSRVVVRPLGVPDERVISYGLWITWKRHVWPGESVS